MVENKIGVGDTCSTLHASKQLGVSQRTIQLWVDSGVLRAWKTPGGHMKISQSAVEKMLNDRHQSLRLNEADALAGFSILYVEDDFAQRQLFANYFARSTHNIKLEFASNGFEGLVSLGGNTPDLLITDLKMPGMDGFEMLRHLQNSKDFSGLNIAVFTSMSIEEIKAHGGLSENVKLFLKPVAFNEIELFVYSLMLSKHQK
jgi:excisionase family DNA binding protein